MDDSRLAGASKVMPSYGTAVGMDAEHGKKEIGKKKKKRARGSPSGKFVVMHHRQGREKGLRGERRPTSL